MSNQCQEQEQEICVPNVETDNISLNITEKKVRSWATGKREWVEVYDGSDDTVNFAFSVSDLRTFKGIMTNSWSGLFISFNLSDEQSAAIKNKVGDPILNEIFKNKAKLVQNHRDIKSVEFLRMIWKGPVSKGNMRDENDESKGFYNDQLTCSVPTKLIKGVPSPNPSEIEIVDLNNKPYEWNSISGDISEAIFEIEKVNLGDKIASRLV
jgi:hypothetical protein